MGKRIGKTAISMVLVFILFFVGMWMTVSQADSFFSRAQLQDCQLAAVTQEKNTIPPDSGVLYSCETVIMPADCCTQELLQQQGTVMSMIQSRVHTHRPLLQLFKTFIQLLAAICALRLVFYSCRKCRDINYEIIRIIHYIHDRDGKKKSIIYA